jgi:Tfp pilus assembly PilM family ATPase
MPAHQPQPDYTYQNVIELLVEQEVARQLKRLPANIKPFLQPVQIITYALNKLPTLYACSERGFAMQLQRARQEYGPQVVKAVHRAIIIVQRDPLQHFTPLKPTEQEQLLVELRILLQDPSIRWTDLPRAIAQAMQIPASETNPKSQTATLAADTPKTWASSKEASKHADWRQPLSSETWANPRQPPETAR